MATINGDSTDNVLNGTASADDITGDAGNDTITAGSGDDVVDGGAATLTPTDLFLNWTNEGVDGDSIATGFTQNTGGINVGVNFTNGGVGTSATVEENATYVAPGEPFATDSGLGLRGSGNGTTWTTDLTFSAATGSGFADEVDNVAFRLQDIDQNSWQDILTVNAYDADGNLIEVTLTAAGDDVVDGNTVTAGPTSTFADDAAGSVLVNVAGPVARIEIIYENGGTGGQLLYITDVHFEAVPTDADDISGEGGNDTLSGGFGNDMLDGGADNDLIDGGTGNDTLIGGTGSDTLLGGDGNDDLSGGSDGDTLEGGAGNDTLDGGTGADSLAGGTGDDSLVGGDGSDTLVGGDGADTLEGGADNDILYAGGGDVVSGGETGTDTGDELIVDDVAFVTFDPTNSENGTVTFNDGSTATFTGIETLTVNGGPDGIVSGTGNDDLIDDNYVDENLELTDNNDGTLGTVGDQDSIEGGTGDDTVYAGAGDDFVTGGPATLTSAQESLSWVAQGVGTDVSSGFTQDTGLANITVSITNDGAMSDAEIDASTQYVDSAAGEPFSTTSALSLTGTGGPDVATVDFTSDVPLDTVTFRINDIDSNGWQDIVTVNAYDADGNVVPVTLTAAGNETVSGQTASGGGGNDNQADANGSVLVEIAGPVTRFEVIYENGGTDGQVAYITDVHFTATDSDNDVLHGDQGADVLDGGAGNDVLFGDQLALDPADFASGTTGTATTVTFENQSPHAVELAQIDDTGAVVPVITIPAGADFITAATTQTNWVLLDPDTGDVLALHEAPADGSTIVFDSTGTDTLTGGLGDDTLSGDFGDDTLSGGDGADSAAGGAGDDLIDGDAGADTLDGGAGADTLMGGAGRDSLTGGDGGDTLNGGDGADTVEGDAGADVIRAEDDATGGVAGSTDPDFGDVITGGTGDDVIFANGSDTVDGGEDAGDADIDVLNVSDVASIQYQDSGGANVGFVTEQGIVIFNDGSTLAFSNIEQVVNLELDGYVEGTSGDDVIDDSYTGDPEDDRVDANDAVLSGEDPQDDIILAGAGNDTVTAGSGDDEIYGDTGAIAPNPDGSGGSGDFGAGPWVFEYYDLDPNGDPRTLAQAGFTDNGGRDNTNTLTSTGATTSINPTDYDTLNDYALKFTTELTVTTGGVYTFETNSDDGSKLFINGVEVVDNDGHHGERSIEGTITLPPGQHIIEIVYYENNGGNVLTSSLSGPDTGDVFVDLASYPALLQPALNSGAGNDALDGGDGNDIIYGEGGDDLLLGGAGNDTLEGGTGADTLDGGADADTLNGGDDADLIIAGGGDVIDGGEGGDDNDTLSLGGDFGATVVYDVGNPENGVVTFSDGSTATFTNIETVVPCFTPGSLVSTPGGLVPVETLQVGDLVDTRDGDPQPIRWIGHKHLDAATLARAPHLAPILIRKDSIAPAEPNRDMQVSPQHRMLIENQATQLWLGEDEVLVKAKHLTHKPGIDVADPSDGVTYIHMMFDAHEIILVDNAWTESFQPGDMLGTDEDAQFSELLELFPELANVTGRQSYVAARLSAKAHEAPLIA